MKEFVGEVHTVRSVHPEKHGRVSYYLEGLIFKWDERGLKLVEKKCEFKVGDKVKETLSQKIVITTDGKQTTAVLYDGKKRIKEASAVCSGDDEFDFMTGAVIACVRLSEEKEPERDLRELLKNGTFGKDDRWGLFVVVGENLVFEDGGYERIENYDSNLKSAFSNINEIYGDSLSFRHAKSGYAEVIWKRGEKQ
jgi:hypothetical protein